jgi:hypothetical protein
MKIGSRSLGAVCIGVLAALGIGLLSAGCGGGSGGNVPTLAVKLVSQARRALRAAERTAVQGLYFGELEIVAYDHRPGQSVQNNPGFGAGTDWSYWVVLQSGHPSARDIVLQENGAIDIMALNGEYGRQEFGAAFQSQVGRFDIDFFEVNFHRTGVVANGGYYGMNANGNGLDKHPLHRYPALRRCPHFGTSHRTFIGFARFVLRGRASSAWLCHASGAAPVCVLAGRTR